jgi:hypothetical protein
VGTFEHGGKQYRIISRNFRKVFLTSYTHMLESSAIHRDAREALEAMTKAVGNSPEVANRVYRCRHGTETAMLQLPGWRKFAEAHPLPQPMELPSACGTHEAVEGAAAADGAGPSQAVQPRAVPADSFIDDSPAGAEGSVEKGSSEAPYESEGECHDGDEEAVEQEVYVVYCDDSDAE